MPDGRHRRLVSDGQDSWVEEKVEDLMWQRLAPHRLGLPDILAISAAREPKLSQDAQIDKGTLEGVPIPPEFLALGERFKEALKDWCRSRSERGKKVTRTVVKRTFSKLLSWRSPELALEALEISAERGWSGVFLPSSVHKVALAVTDHRQQAIEAMRQRGK